MNSCVKFLVAAALLLMLPAAPAAGDDYFAGIDALPADQRFRRLSLMLMIADGTDDRMIENLQGLVKIPSPGAVGDGAPQFDFDDYTTPLNRIVDQETMLAAATRLFSFTRDHAEAIVERLRRIQESDPDLVGTIPGATIAEDAIIIRNAIADSIDYAQLSDEPEGSRDLLSRDYRARTIYLRNNLEYELFAAELERMTQEAVASVGGQTDAFERMFDDEVDAAALNKKITAAEYIYDWDKEFDERAAKLAEEIVDSIWDRESEVDP